LLTREEAKLRREEVREEADFYGAMDGASKFIRGDAIAGILILFINMLGGLAVGAAAWHAVRRCRRHLHPAVHR
jgi:flagellar biosynthesis protein FlhA